MSQLGLPSLRTMDAPGSWGALPGAGTLPGVRIWLCLQRTDMRCGFDRLATTNPHISPLI